MAFTPSETYAVPQPSLTMSIDSRAVWINDSSPTSDSPLSSTWVRPSDRGLGDR